MIKRLILASAIAVVGLFLGRSAGAQESRWVETHRWKGSGTVQTERFLVNASKWRVRYHPLGTGIFQINIFDEDGTLIDVAANWTKPMNAYRDFTGKGIRYLSITGPDTTWEVMIEQYLTAIEEWHLDQMIKLPPRRLTKLATWAGDDTAGAR